MSRIKTQLRLEVKEPGTGRGQVWVDVTLDQSSTMNHLFFSGDVEVARNIYHGVVRFKGNELVEPERELMVDPHHPELGFTEELPPRTLSSVKEELERAMFLMLGRAGNDEFLEALTTVVKNLKNGQHCITDYMFLEEAVRRLRGNEPIESELLQEAERRVARRGDTG